MHRVMAMTLHVVESAIGAHVLAFSQQSSIDCVEASDVTKNPVLESLVRSLLPPEEASEVLRGYYTNAFHAKLLQRLGEIRNEPVADAKCRHPLSLPQRRLKRVGEFVSHPGKRSDRRRRCSCDARLADLVWRGRFRQARHNSETALPTGLIASTAHSRRSLP